VFDLALILGSERRNHLGHLLGLGGDRELGAKLQSCINTDDGVGIDTFRGVKARRDAYGAGL
jgi:hypothetical protein